VDNALAYNQIAELRDRRAEAKLNLEGAIRTEYNFTEVVGATPAMRSIVVQVEIVGPITSTVLIQGETGTGKGLIARAEASTTSATAGERTFVKINCAAIPTGLLEGELFGRDVPFFPSRDSCPSTS
jgi:formate hydrogenlyase transcriptional activator